MIAIRGGRVLDPGIINAISDIYIKNGRIRAIVPHDPTAFQASSYDGEPISTVIDATGKIVTPGLIDMHVHLREPGHEYKETITSGSLAAAHGGFSTICCMPNTDPVNDNPHITEYIIQHSKQASASRVLPVAAISTQLAGNELCEYAALKKAGAVALSDDGRPVVNSRLMRRAMEYAGGFKLPIISHSEEEDLSFQGAMNEGPVATKLGLAGIPNAAESIMVYRDIALCELTGTHLHIAHVSTRQALETIRNAKKKGVPVTAETAPHYFTLTDQAVVEYNTYAKMNPPLRSEADREAVLAAIADGTIDVIATDHAPHSSIEKDIEFDRAANGIIGLETALPLCLKLVRDKVLSMEGLITIMTKNPAQIIGLENDLKIGAQADLTIIDPDLKYVVNADLFQSKSHNTPFNGWEMTGKAVLTMVDGKVVFNGLT